MRMKTTVTCIVIASVLGFRLVAQSAPQLTMTGTVLNELPENTRADLARLATEQHVDTISIDQFRDGTFLALKLDDPLLRDGGGPAAGAALIRRLHENQRLEPGVINSRLVGGTFETFKAFLPILPRIRGIQGLRVLNAEIPHVVQIYASTDVTAKFAHQDLTTQEFVDACTVLDGHGNRIRITIR